VNEIKPGVKGTGQAEEERAGPESKQADTSRERETHKEQRARKQPRIDRTQTDPRPTKR
jgi:hypothetical protein